MRKMKEETKGKTVSPGPLREDEIEKSAEILKALANPARLLLVNILVGGERTVSQLCETAGLKQSMVSQQLKNLRLNGIVGRRKEDSKVYYRLEEKNVVTMLNCLGRCGCSRD
jgi:DNA-binding transcriptional ArsR family regulator